ncbi:MAG: DUF6029 family protein, partial [Verrucomicrobiota bacterium]
MKETTFIKQNQEKWARFERVYASKINDPNAANGYLYKKGEALLVAANYAKKGFAVSVTASRTDNMNFRSDR